MILRPYQEQACEIALKSLELDGNSIICMAQGSGKSIIQAAIASELNQDILILQPSRELTVQNYEKMLNYLPTEEVGIYSAGCDSREIKKITYATIGSIRKLPEEFLHFKTVIVDECDLLNPKGESTMLRKFLAEIGHPKTLGMTATPYRAYSFGRKNDFNWFESVSVVKMINRVQPKFWSRISFNLTTKQLTEAGYLTPIIYDDHSFIPESEMKLNKSRTQLDFEFFEERLKSEEEEIVDLIEELKGSRNSIIVFCSSVEQAERLSEMVKNSGVVTAKTNKKIRKELVENFKNKKLKVLMNVTALSAGFDAPDADCLILLKPTRSLRLYSQILGRITRKAENKPNSLVVDYSGSFRFFGALDEIEIYKDEKGLWDIRSETEEHWHNKELYSIELYPIQSKKEKEFWDNL